MKLKHRQNKFHVIVNAMSIVQLAVQIKYGITINVNVSVKIFASKKRIIAGTL